MTTSVPTTVYPAFPTMTTLLGEGVAAGSLKVGLAYDEAAKEQTCSALADYAATLSDLSISKFILDTCSGITANSAAFEFVSNNDGSMNGWCVSVWTADMVEDGAWCLTDDDNTLWITTVANVEGVLVNLPDKAGIYTYDVQPNGAYAFW